MEATNIYKGHYHILGGTLSALNGLIQIPFKLIP